MQNEISGARGENRNSRVLALAWLKDRGRRFFVVEPRHVLGSLSDVPARCGRGFARKMMILIG